jgi:uncharacterized LabA/DUF88 family protein
MPVPVKKKSIIYIDGFNLYYGALKGTANKWLNLERYFLLLRPNDDIQAIRYFTALVDGFHLANQQAYLRALETLPLVEVIFGKFKRKQIVCGVTGCQYPGNRVFSSREEKRTDVNIAISMLDDARRGLCERIVLVSGDSDLVPALDLVKTSFPLIELIVYVPARHWKRKTGSAEIRGAADRHRSLPNEFFPKSQFPSHIPDGVGGFIRKPKTW